MQAHVVGMGFFRNAHGHCEQCWLSVGWPKTGGQKRVVNVLIFREYWWDAKSWNIDSKIKRYVRQLALSMWGINYARNWKARTRNMFTHKKKSLDNCQTCFVSTLVFHCLIDLWKTKKKTKKQKVGQSCRQN